MTKFSNVVIAFKIDAIDLKRIYNYLDRVIIHSRMPCLVWRHKFIRGTALLFSSGYISIHGCSSLFIARKSGRQYLRKLQKLGSNISSTKWKIVTVTGVVTLPYRINLFIIGMWDNCYYEPEIFPAAVKRLANIRILLYQSGKLIVTGLQRPKLSSSVRDFINELMSDPNIRK